MAILMKASLVSGKGSFNNPAMGQNFKSFLVGNLESALKNRIFKLLPPDLSCPKALNSPWPQETFACFSGLGANMREAQTVSNTALDFDL